MRRIFFLLFFLGHSFLFGQRTTDTTLIRRPFYLGITCSASRFVTPAEVGSMDGDYYRKCNSGQSIGLMFSFPFLRRWDMEVAFEYTGWQGRMQRRNTYTVPNSSPPLSWEQSYSSATYTDFFMLRAVPSYELLHKGKFTVQAGAGGRLAFRSADFPPGNLMGEAGIKVMYTPRPHVGVQVGAWFGKTAFGEYLSLRAAVSLSGMRMYHVRPKHYYVRTYEPAE